MDSHVQVNLLENNDDQSLNSIQLHDKDLMTERSDALSTKPSKGKLRKKRHYCM